MLSVIPLVLYLWVIRTRWGGQWSSTGWKATKNTRSHFLPEDHSAVPSVLLYLQNSAPYCLHCAWLYSVLWSRPPVFLPQPSWPPPSRYNAQVSKTRRLPSIIREGKGSLLHIKSQLWPFTVAGKWCLFFLRAEAVGLQRRLLDCFRTLEGEQGPVTHIQSSLSVCMSGRACARILVSVCVYVCVSIYICRENVSTITG